MADKDEFEGWTPEQLRQYFLTGERPTELPQVVNAPPGQGLQRMQARNVVVDAAQPKTTAEEIEPSAMKRGLAALGGTLQEPVVSGIEKFQLAFPGEGAAGKARNAEIRADRASRRQALQQLRETPAGQAGAFLGEALPYVASAPSVPAQMGTAAGIGFLRGGPEQPKGIGEELMSSVISGLGEAATTGILTKGAKTAGQAVNAARGTYSPAGQRMMDVDAAAQRMGLTGELKPSIGQLDPNSPAGIVERNLPSYSQRVEAQAQKIADELTTRRQVPGAQQGTTETREIPGGVAIDELAKAIRERMAQGTARYQAVDQLAQRTGAGNINPIYSVPQLSGLQRSAQRGDEAAALAVNMVNDYDQYALAWMGNQVAQGIPPRQIIATGIPVTDYHLTRVAVNKALNSLQRMLPREKTSTQTQAQRILTDLRDGLDNEAERWAQQNTNNRQVMDAYNEAKGFYREVVAPAILDNLFARKVVSRRTPFNTAEQLYGAMQHPSNQELIDRLVPTMTPRGHDIEMTLRGLPDVGRTLAKREAPPATPPGGLGAMARTSFGHPLTALAEMAPGLGWVNRSQAAKRLYAAENPLQGGLGRALVGMGQYPQEDLQGGLNRLLGRQ